MSNGESGSRPINLDLAVAPDTPAEAENYEQLYQGLVALHGSIAGNRLSARDFEQLDAEIKSMLRPDERMRYEKPLRPHIPNEPDTVQYARHLHLTKILWARKGLEKLMDDTGY